MVSGKWKVVEDDFSVRAEKGYAGVGGEPRYFIKFKNEPYKAMCENEAGVVVLRLSVFSNPDLVRPPGIFNMEYRESEDRYSLHSFYSPKKVEEWFKEKDIKDGPNVQKIYERMVAFTNEIIKVTQYHGFGISAWGEEWLKSLE